MYWAHPHSELLSGHGVPDLVEADRDGEPDHDDRMPSTSQEDGFHEAHGCGQAPARPRCHPVHVPSSPPTLECMVVGVPPRTDGTGTVLGGALPPRPRCGGAEGVSVVYAATDLRLDRCTVAVKLLSSVDPHVMPAASEAELRLLAAFDHPAS